MPTATLTAPTPFPSPAPAAARAGEAPRARRRAQGDRSQLQFDWLLGDRQWWTLKAAAAVLGMGESFVEKLFDAGVQLSGHEYNAGAGARMTKRIPRAFLVALLINTARYDASTRLEAFVSCRRHFTPDERRRIAEAFLS